jgi:prepilin-type N-terminal cleavage/methylation domain-containing protein
MRKHLVKGFTLLELMMTVAILGILSIIAVPSLVNIYNTQAEQSAATQVLSVFKTARQHAIAMRTNVSVVLLNGEWKAANTADNSVITQQKINSTFKSSLIGIKTSTTNVATATSFGYTSAGVPYVNGSFLNSGQSIFISFSKTQSSDSISIANAKTIGFIIDRNGSMYICKNTVDGQVTQQCNT